MGGGGEHGGSHPSSATAASEQAIVTTAAAVESMGDHVTVYRSSGEYEYVLYSSVIV